MRKVKLLVITWLMVAFVVSSGLVFASHNPSYSTSKVGHNCGLHSGNPSIVILQAD
jgi:hypothetical protein